MARKRYVLVGTGGRAINFIQPMVTIYRDQVELLALCDLSPTRMGYYNRLLAGKFGYHALPAYPADQFDHMLEEQRPDYVTVTSKDSTHHEYILRALRHGCDVVTEKPMTIDAQKCRQILETVAQTKRRVRVAFNYRWAPFRTKVKELLAAGTIGRVMSVNMEYLLNTSHGADYYRRWHSNMADSSGLLVHKSTHHFDLVNWWIDAIPEQVFANGRLDFYGKANALARGDEAFTRYARYTGEPAAKNDPFCLDLHSDESLEGLYYQAEADSGYLRDRNVFREGINIYDNMSATVRYRTGALLTYSLVSYSPREGMRVTFNGDRGRIEYHEFGHSHIIRGQSNEELAREQAGGDEAVEFIHVYPHFKPSYDVPVTVVEGGHGGGDLLLAEQLYAVNPPTDPYQRSAGPEQGAASILVGIAANQSIATHQPVNLLDLVPLKPGAKKLSELK